MRIDTLEYAFFQDGNLSQYACILVFIFFVYQSGEIRQNHIKKEIGLSKGILWK